MDKKLLKLIMIDRKEQSAMNEEIDMYTLKVKKNESNSALTPEGKELSGRPLAYDLKTTNHL